MTKTLRTYSINNFYLSGIHAGIQSAHSHDELTLKYIIPALKGSTVNKTKLDMLIDCIQNHKAMVVLNGGFQENLINFLNFLTQNEEQLDYPFAPFYESQEALNGALTNISIVLPDKIFKYSRVVPRLIDSAKKDGVKVYNDFINDYVIEVQDNAKYTLTSSEDLSINYTYNEEEVELMRLISFMNLMS